MKRSLPRAILVETLDEDAQTEAWPAVFPSRIREVSPSTKDTASVTLADPERTPLFGEAEKGATASNVICRVCDDSLFDMLQQTLEPTLLVRADFPTSEVSETHIVI